MGWRFRKIFRSGPFRWSWTKKGVGWSWGLGGFRYGVNPTGQRYISFGIRGTGLYYIKYLDKNKSFSPPTSYPNQSPSQQQQGLPISKSNVPWWKNP